MSSIYISGMEIPKDGTTIFAIRTDGMIEDVMGCFVGKAIPVPNHGDLIDADALLHDMNRMVLPDDLAYTIGHGIAEQFIETAPTIIPADGKDGAE